MRKVYLLALSLCFPLGASGHEEEPIASLHVPHRMVVKWLEPYEGPERVVELILNRRERHFAVAVTHAPVDPARPYDAIPATEALCHFTLNQPSPIQHLGVLSYKDPHTGHTLFLTPF